MDQGTKDLLRTFKRVHFWILCPLIVVAGVVTWLLAVNSLHKETTANSGKIGQLFQTLSSVKNQERHANDQVAQGMEQLISERRTEVAAAWTERWNQQTGILTWPQELEPKLLEKVEGLRPIERHVAFPADPQTDIAINLRRHYRDYIKKELPKLAQQIGANWDPSGSSGREQTGRRPRRRRDGDDNQRGGDGPVDHSIVGWDAANQMEIETNHFDWTSRRSGARDAASAGGEGVPSVLEILYAQEDLWVLRSIMSVIERTNEGATTRFNAAVKEINSIQIGRNAAGSQGSITRASAAGPASPDDMFAAMPREGAGLSRRQVEGVGADAMEDEGTYAAVAVPQDDPADLRYVDRDYNPLPAVELRSVMSPDAEKTYLAVAKRMPVRMRLRVDQRRLNKLLAECAGAELTIEVRQVRINPDKTAEPASNVRMPSREMQAYGGGMQTAANRSAEDLFQYDVDVELYGIVYIYNPVDNTILGVTEETTDANAIAEPEI